MAGITVSDIMNANQLWTTSATSWADFLLGIQNNASYLDTNVSHPLSTAWHGTAAELASGPVSTVKGGLIDTAGRLSTIQGLAIANGVSPSPAGTGTTTTSGNPIAPNSQGLYLPPNATQAESNAS
jgi:hypothetical protein